MDAGPVHAPGPHVGRVSSFDRRRGLGVVTSESGHAFDFHATAISDGTRDIAVGTAVAFLVTPGLLGRYEARGLRVVDDSHQRPT
jgi:cold shock CspA family protein